MYAGSNVIKNNKCLLQGTTLCCASSLIPSLYLFRPPKKKLFALLFSHDLRRLHYFGFIYAQQISHMIKHRLQIRHLIGHWLLGCGCISCCCLAINHGDGKLGQQRLVGTTVCCETLTAVLVLVDDVCANQIPLTLLGMIDAFLNLIASSATPMSPLAPPASSIKGAMTTTLALPPIKLIIILLVL